MVLVLTSAFVRSAVEAEIGRPCVTTRQRQSTQISISMVMVKYLLQHSKQAQIEKTKHIAYSMGHSKNNVL